MSIRSSRKKVKEEEPLATFKGERLRGTEVDLEEYVNRASIICTDLSKNEERPGKVGGEQGQEVRVCILALGYKQSK